MTNSKYGRVIAIATAICLTALGLAFIICCTHLYFTGGDNPFSRESVGEYLIILAIPSIITVALVIAGFIFAYVYRIKENELAKRTNLEILESFESRFVFDSFDEETRLKIYPLKQRRNIASIVAASVSVLCSVIIFIYLVFVGDFPNKNLNNEVISALAVVLPLSVIALAVHVPKIYIVEECAKQEYELLKASIKMHGIPTLADIPAPEKLFSGINAAKCAIFLVAIVLVILGVTNGGMNDVLQKGIKICTECIGLG